jgi:predicted ferric reductase
MSDPTFFPKLVLYIFHWGGLLFGVVGSVLMWKRWRWASVLWGVMAYFLLIHFVLLALPRYLFPIMPAVWVFAAVGLLTIITRRRPQIS